MMELRNIFLIGYRCTGKTTVGKALAGRLAWSFVDSDQMVAAASGTSIARMVADKGWQFFREREHEALVAVCANNCQVVATGGGIILDDRNRRAMQNSGNVVWLTASEKIIQARMLDDKSTAGNRPSLTDQGMLEEIESVLAERRPIYEEISDLVIDTDRKTVAEICDRIVKQLRIEEVER